jgi:hypothetical protein
VYFFVECFDNITPYTDSLWMNLYIDCDQENQGWNTFDFVVNKSAASEGTLVLERFTADNDYSKTEKVADVAYKADGKTMTVKIPKSALGLEGSDYTINFAWTDNVHDEGDYTGFSGDILDFYATGDVAPGGRFKYSFVSTAENSGKAPETEPITEETASDTTDTPASHETASDGSTSDETGSDNGSEGGCRSALSCLPALLLIPAAALIPGKKERD